MGRSRRTWVVLLGLALLHVAPPVAAGCGGTFALGSCCGSGDRPCCEVAPTPEPDCGVPTDTARPFQQTHGPAAHADPAGPSLPAADPARVVTVEPRARSSPLGLLLCTFRC